MSETQPPNTPTTEVTPTPAPVQVVSNDDLRLLYDAEKLKREGAEKKLAELEAAHAELKSYNETQNASLNGHLKEARAKLGQAEERATFAEKKLEDFGERMKTIADEAYSTYLLAWSELKIGKLTLPKVDKSSPPEIAAIAIAAFDHVRNNLSSRIQFKTQLNDKLGL